MCVRAYRRRVSVVDVRVSRACARGERLLGVINIIMYGHGIIDGRMAVEFLDPLGREGKPSNIPGGICW